MSDLTPYLALTGARLECNKFDYHYRAELVVSGRPVKYRSPTNKKAARISGEAATRTDAVSALARQISCLVMVRPDRTEWNTPYYKEDV